MHTHTTHTHTTHIHTRTHIHTYQQQQIRSVLHNNIYTISDYIEGLLSEFFLYVSSLYPIFIYSNKHAHVLVMTPAYRFL